MDWRNPRPEFLPGILASIARGVGFETALKVAAHWSGRRFVAATAPREHPLYDLCGAKQGRLVHELLRAAATAGRVDIPKATHQRRMLAVARLLFGEGKSVAVIARETGLWYRSVERIVAALRADEGQSNSDGTVPTLAIDIAAADCPCPFCGYRPPRRRLRLPRSPSPLPLFGDE